jgi:ankyrin repeat protein
MLASFLGHLSLVELLLVNDASRSSVAKVRLAAGGATRACRPLKGCSVMHGAVLTKLGAARLNLCRNVQQNGSTALDAAFKSGNDDVIFALLTLTDAVKREDQSYVERILARPDVDVDECVTPRQRVCLTDSCFCCCL